MLRLPVAGVAALAALAIGAAPAAADQLPVVYNEIYGTVTPACTPVAPVSGG